MTDDRRRFALRENGEETSVFTGRQPRQAALKAARRLEPSESEEDAMATSERICLREHGTVDIHIYDAWAWEGDAPDTSPDWLGEEVTEANVSKVDIRRTTKSEDELQYDGLEPLLVEQPIEVTKEECEQCGESLDDSYLSATYVKDVPSVIGEITYQRYGYRCSSCGKKTSGEHQEWRYVDSTLGTRRNS